MEKSQRLKEGYLKKVDQVSPKHNLLVNSTWAFFVGGTICIIGQAITNILVSFGYVQDEAGTLTSVILIFIGAFLTGIDVYDSIGKYAGAGSIVPITGFSNSVVSPAMEYKKEGYVMGIGAKMFTVAGPVIVYGTISSMIVGIIYYLIK